MAMKVQALNDKSLIEIDEECYRDELALKNELLGDEYDQYFRALPGTEDLQWGVIELLLPNMVYLYPQHFELTIAGRHWTWCNRLLGQETQFILGDSDSLPLAPLDWLGRQVQEDLLVLSGDTTRGMPLVA